MQIIPIKDLRDTNKMSELCNSTDEPIFITKNGYGDMVIMSMSTYEEKLARLEMLEKIMAGLKDLEEGKTASGSDTLNSFREKYAK